MSDIMSRRSSFTATTVSKVSLPSRAGSILPSLPGNSAPRSATCNTSAELTSSRVASYHSGHRGKLPYSSVAQTTNGCGASLHSRSSAKSPYSSVARARSGFGAASYVSGGVSTAASSRMSSVTRQDISHLQQMLENERQERMQAERALESTTKELEVLEEMLAKVS